MKKNKDEENDIKNEVGADDIDNENATEETGAEEVKEESDPKNEEILKLKDQMLRQLAEYDNYRKRTARERMDLEAEIISKTVTEFLPTLDNLERALAHECSDENFKKGVEMIYDSFLETLSKLGIEVIGTDGEDFNPAYHQAVQQVESAEVESGKICETFQKGYKIGEKVIRFAMVAVAN